MEYRKDKRTGDEISLLGFGNMRLPVLNGDGANIDYDTAKKMIDAAMAAGVNYYDTAYGYHDGKSEEFIGKALGEYERSSYHLATKLPMWSVHSKQDALDIFANQLKRCNTGYFDYYMFHGIDDGSYSKIADFGLFEWFEQLRAEGTIRHIGFSFHGSVGLLAQMCEEHEWDFAQIQLNYFDWEYINSKELYEILEKYKIPCIVMEPVRGGRLAGLGKKPDELLKAKYPDLSIASWAMRWVGAKPNVLCVLSGMSTMQQVQDNIATFSPLKPLSGEDNDILDKAVQTLKQVAIVPCTACRYCMPCPSGVDIPLMMQLVNDCAFDGDSFGLRQRYTKIDKDKNAGNCIKCGACEAICPQKLPIMDILEKINADTSN